MGAKLGLITLGAKANYYFKPIDYNQWNGHVGLGYELSFAWIVPNTIFGPTLVIGTEHLSTGGFLIGLEGGVIGASYGNTTDNSGNPVYPIINLKVSKLF